MTGFSGFGFRTRTLRIAYSSIASSSWGSSAHAFSAAATRSVEGRAFAFGRAGVRLKNLAGCLLMFPWGVQNNTLQMEKSCLLSLGLSLCVSLEVIAEVSYSSASAISITQVLPTI